jgi:hypothetical protein
MTYEVNGKQYVVTVGGGHGSFGTKLGDYIPPRPCRRRDNATDAGWLGNLEVLLRRFWKCLGSNNDLVAGAGLKFSERGIPLYTRSSGGNLGGKRKPSGALASHRRVDETR